MQICGRNTSTPPTPPMTPLTSRLCKSPAGVCAAIQAPTVRTDWLIRSIGICAAQKISANSSEHDDLKNDDARDRMRENVVNFFRPGRTPRRRRIHDLRWKSVPSIRSAPGRDSRCSPARRRAWRGPRRLARLAGDEPLHFVFEFANPHAGARGNRNHGTAEFGAEFRHVNADAVAPGHVHHVQRHDDGTIQFEHLADEKQIPFEIRRVHDDQRRVRRRDVPQAARATRRSQVFHPAKSFPGCKAPANPRRQSGWSPMCARPTRRSTVVPGKLAVLARRPVSALNRVVLPALGLPTSASVKA